MAEQRVFGPPGTGKTSLLSRWIWQTAEKRGSECMLVASFTRAAASELAGRRLPIHRDRLGTLHSHAYRSIGSMEIAEAQLAEEWNKLHRGWQLSVKQDVDEVIETGGALDGDRFLGQCNVYRARMIPVEEWGDRYAVDFYQAWQQFKADTHSIDFTDMIALALRDTERAPNNPSVGFFDEVQDFTKLELTLVRHWGASMEQIVLAGDDDQCQPRGTMVETTRGAVPIEQLRAATDCVVSYNRQGAEIRRGGRPFRVQSRPYSGTVYDISTGRYTTTCTPNHKWLVKWNDAAKDRAHVVYLMRKGERWRIGWCKLFRNDSCFHLGARAHIERADAAWVLDVTEDRTEASVLESVFATKYGLPTITFKEVQGSTHATQAAIDRVFTLLGDQSSRAQRLLGDLELDVRYPLWSPENVHRGGTSIMTVRASNLLSGYMAVPVTIIGERKAVEWLTLTRTPKRYDGDVYSLDVEVDETYIADGIVTHNCIYRFKGATPDAFLDPPVDEEHKRVLKQSHRLPYHVQLYAQRWIELVKRREPKAYQPRSADGAVRFVPEFRLFDANTIKRTLDDAGRYLAEYVTETLPDGTVQTRPKTVMFLASCGYMLDMLKHELRRQGIPFHNPYRRSRGDWNPLRASRGVSSSERLIAYLAAEKWSGQALNRWLHVLKKTGILQKGGATFLQNMQDTMRQLTTEELLRALTPEALESARRADTVWLEENLLASYRKPMEFPLTVARLRGVDTLAQEPQVVIGTIHSVKGGQADAVYLFPDVAREGYIEFASGGESQDAIIRQFYVGMTRAREALVICGAGSRYYVDLPQYVPSTRDETL